MPAQLLSPGLLLLLTICHVADPGKNVVSLTPTKNPGVYLALSREAAQSRVAAIGIELEERESSLRQQLQQHQATAASQVSSLTAEVARLTHELDISLSQASLLMHLLSLHLCPAVRQANSS